MNKGGCVQRIKYLFSDFHSFKSCLCFLGEILHEECENDHYCSI
jgi:hypothetical protein